MKRFFIVFSLLAFVAVYAAPALTMPADVAVKIITVDKDKKKASKAKKAETAACCTEAEKANCKANCTEAEKANCKAHCTEAAKANCQVHSTGAVKASCGEKNCAATCKEAASCKGNAAAGTGEKK